MTPALTMSDNRSISSSEILSEEIYILFLAEEIGQKYVAIYI
jgi:hypothetical protein